VNDENSKVTPVVAITIKAIIIETSFGGNKSIIRAAAAKNRIDKAARIIFGLFINSACN
jgi:hypothetical protein